MGSFSLSGGVEVFGFISPSDTTDTYPVIDPLYGIDGLRNVDLLSDLNSIPTLRRRAGMVVGVSGGTTYYKLNLPPWTNTLSDWSIFNSGGSSGGTLSGDYLPLSGGTMTGGTIFLSGLSANTISATTYQNLPTDVFVTGGTFSGGDIIFTNNTGGTFNVSGISSFDTFVTGFSYNDNTFTISQNSGSSFSTTINSVTGLTSSGTINSSIFSGGTFFGDGSGLSGLTDTYVTGATFSGTSLIISQNENQPDITATLSSISLSGALSSITFNIISSAGISASTISATTYQNLPRDVFVTGGTYVGSTLTFTNNTGGTFNVTGITTSATFTGGTVSGPTTFISGLTASTISATTYQNLPRDVFVTGGTFSSGTITFRNNTGGTFNVVGLVSADTFTTAFTYSNNVFTLSRNQGQSNLTATINSVTGWTVNGNTSITGNLIVTGTSALNGTISSSGLVGSTDRVVQVSSGGTISATLDIVSGYITSGGTVALLLDNTNNWDINGNYTGSTITGTYQGQKHYNNNYFFEAVADNLFIRLIRG